MASSRHMRRSRRTSPTENAMPDHVAVKNETYFDSNHDDLSGDWVEPPLRAPVPSFEDYKGLERQGVLEHMAPLGTLPGSKVRARLKLHEPGRRMAHLRNGELRAAREEASTPDPAPAAARRSEPRKMEERAAKVSSSRERDEDNEYTPTFKGPAKVVPAKAASMSTALHGTISSRTAQGRQKLREIVDSAVKRSNELGDPVLGDAVKELYEESLRSPTVAELLDAVLTQRPSVKQTAEFQSRIRAARKKHRENQKSHETTSKVSSSPSTIRSAKSSETRHLDSSKNPSNPFVLHACPPQSDHRSTRQIADIMGPDLNALHEERPSKRVKRSKSASSDSSLSSLDSAIDEEPPPSLNATYITNQKLHQPKAQLSNGPRLGTFPIRPTDSASRKSIPLLSNSHITVDEAAIEKREELRRKYNKHVIAKESAIRSSPSPMALPHPNPPILNSSSRNPQTRLRNGLGHGGKDEDSETIESPASSNFGDLLIPPPAGASRGSTPNHLGRPPKTFRKAARIKMSPLKKRNATTAGRGAEGESSLLSNARTNNGQTDGAQESCTACSGGGMLVCCDGCPRSYHFTCCDPPLKEAPADDWFCMKCSEDRAPPPPPMTPSIFSPLISKPFRKGEMSYALPSSIRQHYEGVTTGEDGEYDEEIGVVKKKKTTRGGYEEITDNLKLKDGKENTIFCFRCAGSSLALRQSNDIPAVGRAGREMIQCDYCNLSWHLECLDPPLAVAPPKESKTSRILWMCPNHVDPLLNNIDPKANPSNQDRPTTSRNYRIRRPKNLTFVNTALTRGSKNNGLIEVVSDSDDDEALTPPASPQYLRIPQRSIKLDFIDRMKRSNEEAKHNARLQREAEEVKKAEEAALYNSRPFAERKVALNLVQMAHNDDANISADVVQNLISTLIAEAPENVGELAAAEDEAAAAEVTEEERQNLEALIELAKRRLAGGCTKAK